MTDLGEQIKAIEKEIRDTPYHKATEHHIGKLRAKLAKLRDKHLKASTKSKGGGGGYAVKKQGDATIVLVGSPSVGKSTLLNKLTNARSKIAPYEFTTVSVIPGMMNYKNAKIQILDVPGLIEGAEEGKGRGREVLSVVRAADLLLLITEVGKEDRLLKIVAALEKNGIRVNQAPPDVKIEKKVGGGINIYTNMKQDLDKETIKQVAQESGIKNGEIIIKEKLTLDRLIDAFVPSRVYIPAIKIVNKSDLLPKRSTKRRENYFLISAKKGKHLDKLKEAIWQQLKFVRVYLVKPGDEPSLKSPIIMKLGNTLKDVSEKIATDFVEGKKRAVIWSTGAKYPGQEVSLSKKVQEGMQVGFI